MVRKRRKIRTMPEKNNGIFMRILPISPHQALEYKMGEVKNVTQNNEEGASMIIISGEHDRDTLFEIASFCSTIINEEIALDDAMDMRYDNARYKTARNFYAKISHYISFYDATNEPKKKRTLSKAAYQFLANEMGVDASYIEEQVDDYDIHAVCLYIQMQELELFKQNSDQYNSERHTTIDFILNFIENKIIQARKNKQNGIDA